MTGSTGSYVASLVVPSLPFFGSVDAGAVMIQIEEHCLQDLKFLRVAEWDARTTVTRADAEDVLDFDGPVVTICEKEHGGGLRLIAITTATSAKPTAISFVFPLPDGLTSGKTPLDTFKSLCGRYAIEFGGGDVTGRLFIRTEVPGSVSGVTPPEDIRLGTSCFLGAQDPERGVTKIFFAFAMDLAALAEDLQPHEVPLRG